MVYDAVPACELTQLRFRRFQNLRPSVVVTSGAPASPRHQRLRESRLFLCSQIATQGTGPPRRSHAGMPGAAPASHSLPAKELFERANAYAFIATHVHLKTTVF